MSKSGRGDWIRTSDLLRPMQKNPKNMEKLVLTTVDHPLIFHIVS